MIVVRIVPPAAKDDARCDRAADPTYGKTVMIQLCREAAGA
jgi:hypothetical protein